jgi:hypothetical protein
MYVYVCECVCMCYKYTCGCVCMCGCVRVCVCVCACTQHALDVKRSQQRSTFDASLEIASRKVSSAHPATPRQGGLPSKLEERCECADARAGHMTWLNPRLTRSQRRRTPVDCQCQLVQHALRRDL